MGALLAALAPAAIQAADVSGAAATAAADASGISADAILPPPTPLTANQTLYLDVSLNSTPRGLMPFIENRGRLQASPDVLRQLGFNANGDAPVYLDQISGAVVRYDARLQTLALDVPLDQLTLPTTVLSRPQTRAPAGSASPGLLLNYDVYGSRVDTLGNLSLSSELRLFGVGNGTFENTAVSRRYQQPGDRRWRGESVRLDTRWSLDFPDKAMTLEVGDFYSGFVDWTRPVRLGGLQIGRNYGLQPYRVLTPTPSFLGQAVVPSTVELYVDGLRQYSGQVPVGPFQLAAQPGISGTGNAQVVVTDAFGRMQTLDFSFYGTQQLLAKGLSDWSVGVGNLREDFGQRSFAYDDRTVASASWRGGISDTFTGEAHAEGGGGLAQAGIGGWWLLGGAGVFNAAYAHSNHHGLQGGQWALGYSWNNRRLNVNLRSVRRACWYCCWRCPRRRWTWCRPPCSCQPKGGTASCGCTTPGPAAGRARFGSWPGNSRPTRKSCGPVTRSWPALPGSTSRPAPANASGCCPGRGRPLPSSRPTGCFWLPVNRTCHGTRCPCSGDTPCPWRGRSCMPGSNPVRHIPF